MSADPTELLAEYAKNFAALEVKYASLEAEHGEAQRRMQRFEAALAASQAEAEAKAAEAKRLAADLEDAAAMRDRLTAANVTIEHLKGRLEAMRKAAADREGEFQAQLDQERLHARDLAARLDVVKDAPTLRALQQGRDELEERCAVLAARTLEQREMGAQERATTAAVVRDLQARNSELEQRARSLDTELTTLRTAARRALDLQREVVSERDRTLADAAAAQAQLADLRRQQADEAAAVAARDVSRTQAAAALQREWDAEREALTRRIAEAEAKVTEVVALRAGDVERQRVQQRQHTGALEAQRAELTTEAEAVRRQLAAAQDELQRASHRYQALERALEEARRNAKDTDARATADAQRAQTLQLRVEAAATTEAWLTAERDRLQELVARSGQRCQELEAALRAAEELRTELERMRLQAQFRERDLEEARADAARAVDDAARAQSAFDMRAQAMRREAKDAKRTYNNLLKKQEAQKKTLLLALLEKEQQDASAATARALTVASAPFFGGATAVPGPSLTVGGVAMHHQPPADANAPQVDAVELLKAQQESVRHFQARMGELLHPGPSVV